MIASVTSATVTSETALTCFGDGDGDGDVCDGVVGDGVGDIGDCDSVVEEGVGEVGGGVPVGSFRWLLAFAFA